ncbi:hypothetical protein P8452_50115 [Trifolium repens]|nr:hypothetical protein P8452_50115 [Trifolium repens]
MNKKREKVEKLSGFHQAGWTHLCINSKEAAQVKTIGTLVIRSECSFNSILGSRHVDTESDSGSHLVYTPSQNLLYAPLLTLHQKSCQEGN